jgi:hypothetical protein
MQTSTSSFMTTSTTGQDSATSPNWHESSSERIRWGEAGTGPSTGKPAQPDFFSGKLPVLAV